MKNLELLISRWLENRVFVYLEAHGTSELLTFGLKTLLVGFPSFQVRFIRQLQVVAGANEPPSKVHKSFLLHPPATLEQHSGSLPSGIGFEKKQATIGPNGFSRPEAVPVVDAGHAGKPHTQELRGPRPPRSPGGAGVRPKRIPKHPATVGSASFRLRAYCSPLHAVVSVSGLSPHL